LHYTASGVVTLGRWPDGHLPSVTIMNIMCDDDDYNKLIIKQKFVH